MQQRLEQALGLDAGQARALSGLWQQRSFEAGARLMGLDGTADFLALVLSGELSLVTRASTSILLGPGEVVGELALLTERGRSAEVFGETSGELAVLDYARVRQLERDDPARALLLHKSLARLATRRLLDEFASIEGYLALVAHDGRKDALLELVSTHGGFFASRDLVSTESTARRIEEATPLRVRRRVASGPRGGDQEIGSMISRGFVAAVFFFRNPLASWAHQADVDALMRLCDVHDVPLATNRASAEALLALLESEGRATREAGSSASRSATSEQVSGRHIL